DAALGRTSIEAGISLAQQLKTTFILGQAKTCLAACRLNDGTGADVLDLCREAISLAEKAGDKFTEALARRTLGEALGRQVSNIEAAAQAIREAIAIQEIIGARPELARSCAAYAGLLQKNDERAAAPWSERAAKLFRELGMARDLAQI